MFDRVAPGYDRMNRIISLGPRHRLAPADRRRARPPARVARARPRVRHRRPLPRPRDCRLPTRRRRLLRRDAGAAPAPTRRSSAATAQSLPLPTGRVDGVVCGFALRNFVDFDVGVRRVRAGAAARRPLRRARRHRARAPVMRAGNAVWFRGAVPLLGRILAHDADAYRYLPRSTAYLPAPDALLGDLHARGLRRRRPDARSPAVRCSSHRDPGMTSTAALHRGRPAGRHRECPAARSRAAAGRRAPAVARPGRVRLAARAPARPRVRHLGWLARVSSRRGRRGSWARSTSTTTSARPGHRARSRWARCPSTPAPRASWWSRPGSSASPPTGGPGAPRSARRRSPPVATPVGADALRRAAPSTPATDWRAAVETILAAIARGDVEKVVLAREVLVEADEPFDAPGRARPPARAAARLLRVRGRRPRRRQPRAARAPDGHGRRVTPDGRHRRVATTATTPSPRWPSR